MFEKPHRPQDAHEEEEGPLRFGPSTKKTFPTTASARASVISGYGRGDPTLERLAISQKKIEVPNVSPELMAM